MKTQNTKQKRKTIILIVLAAIIALLPMIFFLMSGRIIMGLLSAISLFGLGTFIGNELKFNAIKNEIVGNVPKGLLKETMDSKRPVVLDTKIFMVVEEGELQSIFIPKNSFKETPLREAQEFYNPLMEENCEFLFGESSFQEKEKNPPSEKDYPSLGKDPHL